MKVKINKLEEKLDVSVDIPSSKSLSVRALLLSAIADGVSVVKNILSSDDINDCVNALRGLGISLKQDKDNFEVAGCGGVFPVIKKETRVFVGSSGITSRFLLALIVASMGKTDDSISVILDGSEQLRNRTIRPLVDSLLSIGASIEYQGKDGCLPLLIKPAKLVAENISVSGKLSSQYVSAVLMMSPMLEKPVNVSVFDIDSENHPYIQMALRTMEEFNVYYSETKKDLYTISPQQYKAREFIVETDFNSANYFFALACATGSKIEVKNLNKNTQQPGLLFLDLLEKMGCIVSYGLNSIVVTGPDKLKGGFDINMFSMAEMTMTLAVLAVFADAPIRITGVEHIRGHESDRIFAICNELREVGLKCEEFDDGLKVYCGVPNNSIVKSHGDHRIAMSLAILGVAGSGIAIENSEAVSKTFPEFFDLLTKIGVDLSYE